MLYHLGSISVINFDYYFLHSRPCELKTAFLHLYTEDEDEQRRFAKAAQKDWETLLLQRAKELRTGNDTNCYHTTALYFSVCCLVLKSLSYMEQT